MTERTGRAKRLSRDDRRNAIMEAIVPLIVAHGRSVTSKQIAEAAGVAEGTIYSVFDDKDELLEATVHHHLERASMSPKIDELPPGFPLSEVIERVVDLTQNRVRETFALMAAVRFGQNRPREETHKRLPSSEAIITRLADLLTPYREELSVPPRRAAQIIRIATFSMTLPMMTDGEEFTAHEIAELLMHGITATVEPVVSDDHPDIAWLLLDGIMASDLAPPRAVPAPPTPTTPVA